MSAKPFTESSWVGTNVSCNSEVLSLKNMNCNIATCIEKIYVRELLVVEFL